MTSATRASAASSPPARAARWSSWSGSASRDPYGGPDDLDQLRHWATVIGGRYMGADRAAEYGARNGVPGELLVRIRPAKVIAERDIAS